MLSYESYLRKLLLHRYCIENEITFTLLSIKSFTVESRCKLIECLPIYLRPSTGGVDVDTCRSGGVVWQNRTDRFRKNVFRIAKYSPNLSKID